VRTSPLSTANHIGLGLAVLLSLMDLLALLFPTPPGEVGPPYAVLVLSALLGVVTLAAVVVAWRSGSRRALRLAAAARTVSAITTLPAFFVGPPAWILVLAALSVVLTIACVVLLLSPARRTAAVTD
jgi:hypothetical protein